MSARRWFKPRMPRLLKKSGALRALLLLLAALGAHGLARAQVDEQAAKAAFVYNFIQFTEWPRAPEEPFVLCVLGASSLDEQLRRLEAKKVQNGLTLSVRRITSDDDLSRCHALYIEDRYRQSIGPLLTRLRETPVLTMTDGDGLADKGLMIEIQKRGSRLGFEVNLKVARHAKLNFSARMLKMANYVAADTP